MRTRTGAWLAAAVIAALVVVAVAVVAVTGGPPAPAPPPPGGFAFAAMGDAPYYVWEEWRYRLLLRDVEAHELSWVLHVGDIFWRPCSDAHYRESLRRFQRLPHPVIYTPGDNEWTDCWEEGSGAHEPLERLRRLREIFFSRPRRSLGGAPLPLVSQGGGGRFPAFVENARWTHRGVVFSTVHLVGSRNATVPFPGRTAADDAAVGRRTAAAVAWLGVTFAAARESGAPAVVVAFHAAPAFAAAEDDPWRRAYDPFLRALEEEVAAFGAPVLVVHGDDHEYTVDHPLVRRSTGRRLDNLTRLQVPGSPDVGWVRVTVTPGAEEPFAFDERVVPAWKYW